MPHRVGLVGLEVMAKADTSQATSKHFNMSSGRDGGLGADTMLSKYLSSTFTFISCVSPGKFLMTSHRHVRFILSNCGIIALHSSVRHCYSS